SGHFQRLLLHFRLSAGGLSLPASRSHRTERGGLVQSRRQGGVSTPRGRYGRKEEKARDPRREARVPDDQDPAQRYDRQRAFGERREGGPPEGDRRGHGQGRRQGAHGRRHADAEELEPPLQAQPRQDEDRRHPRARGGRPESVAPRPREGALDGREADVREGQEDPGQRIDVREGHGRGSHGRVARRRPGRRERLEQRRQEEDCCGEDDGEGGREDRDQGAGEEGSGEEARREEEGDRRREVSSWAVLAAAGGGERLGADRPKAFVRLGERVLLAESMERLDAYD